MARVDKLTGLINRVTFFEEAEPLFETCRRSHKPSSVLIVNIDHFKDINNQFGYTTTDTALANLAQLIKNGLRETDIACRFGGQEFVIFMPNTTSTYALQQASELKKKISDSITISNKEVTQAITASFGVADFGQSVEELVKYVIRAMENTKPTGDNQISAYNPPSN